MLTIPTGKIRRVGLLSHVAVFQTVGFQRSKENSESINLSQRNMLQISQQKANTNLSLGTKIFICSGNQLVNKMFSSSKTSEYFEFLSHYVPSVVPTTKPNPHWTTGTRTSWSQTNSSASLCNFSERALNRGWDTKQRINKSQSWLKATVDRHRTVLLAVTPSEPFNHLCLDWPYGCHTEISRPLPGLSAVKVFFAIAEMAIRLISAPRHKG